MVMEEDQKEINQIQNKEEKKEPSYIIKTRKAAEVAKKKQKRQCEALVHAEKTKSPQQEVTDVSVRVFEPKPAQDDEWEYNKDTFKKKLEKMD